MAVPQRTGNALAIAQVETLTVANTWAANDTATVTINGRTITLTIGTTATTTQIATELAIALSSESDLGTGYSVNERGSNIAEFREFTAVASSSTVVLTGVTKGKPFTVTTGETTVGSGTLTTVTTIAASGPNHFTGTGNWSTGAVPVDSDDIVFSNGSTDLLYALDQNGVTPASLKIFNSFTGKIGLKNYNTDDSTYPYYEYRDKYLKCCASGDSLNTAVTIGQGAGSGSARLKLDFNTGQVTAVIYNTGSRSEEIGVPPLLIKGTNTSNAFDIRKGDVGIGYFVGDSAGIATLRVSYVTSQNTDATVVCGPGVTFATPTILIDGGNVTLESATTGGTIVLNAGTLNILGGTHPSIVVNGGTLHYSGTGTLTSLTITGGTFNRSRDDRSVTITSVFLHEGATYNDPSGVVTETNGIDLVQCGIHEVTINKGRNFTIQKSAI